MIKQGSLLVNGVTLSHLGLKYLRGLSFPVKTFLSCPSNHTRENTIMPSRPTTPSRLLPQSRDEWRFRSITTPTEWIESYRPGLYHPVLFGDEFNDGRYKVLQKLGHGSFSTVWLAKDAQSPASSNLYVALKILTANTSLSENESTILDSLSRSSHQHPGKGNVMTLLDSFDHSGPNGVHRCLVFEAMGPSAATLLEEDPEKFGGSSEEPRLPLWMARSVIHQVLLAIDFLHRNNVIHSDIQPGNILFSVKGLASTDENQLTQEVDDFSTAAVQRIDGKTDLWAPRYLAVDQSLMDYVDLDRTFQIKVSDMGAAFFSTQPPKKPVTPVALRSPELISCAQTGPSQDIWSLACLIFEFITGTQLFAIGSYGCSQEEVDDEHYLQLMDILGPFPESLAVHWPRYSIYCNAKGEKVRKHIGELPDEVDADSIEDLLPLEAFFDAEKPAEMDEEESSMVKGLLRNMLDYDPTARPTASALMGHPWFATTQNSNSNAAKT